MSFSGITEGFQNTWGVTPYDYQVRLAECVLEGRSVILQAPTGSGKTWAALFPYLLARSQGLDFPRKCIYSVPMRVLANQFWADVSNAQQSDLVTTIQTGARSEDPKLEGDIIFTTIDQTLSSFLNIPYSLSLGQGNLNAGAIISSYLVFDELHLFGDEALKTTWQMLRMLKGIVPFVAMTATFTADMAQMLAKELDAEPLVISQREASNLPSQQKTRVIEMVEQPLTAQAVLAHHQQRSIAICNTVDRAQMLFQDLRALASPGVQVRLLHSRFLRHDRDSLENWLRSEFGKNKEKRLLESAILVATQVIEVGIDISSQALHTELAPAASIVQRAGRCARYQGDSGTVFVYRLAEDDRGNPRYAPYLEQKDICDKTWPALAARAGTALGFHDELRVVNEAHREADQRWWMEATTQRHTIRKKIADTISAQTRNAVPELIRDVDSRTVIVHPDPSSISNPWFYEGFGLYSGSLFGAFKAIAALATQLGEDWACMTVASLPEEEASREASRWQWRRVESDDQLRGALLVAVNPKLAHYDPLDGFRLGVASDGTWQSPCREQERKGSFLAHYERETLQEHVARMIQVYNAPFLDPKTGVGRAALRAELAYAGRRMETRFGWTQGVLDELARLVIALHDLGKLSKGWQSWAHKWQAALTPLRGAKMALSANYMAAHTDYDESNPAEISLNTQTRGQRPPHAVESAAVGEECLWSLVRDQRALVQAALTAIARHHSAGAAGNHAPFQPHPCAQTAAREALAVAGFGAELLIGTKWTQPRDSGIGKHLIEIGDESQLLVYWLLARALRLADQRSQQLNA